MIITITGPRSVGKSTISQILAEKLNLKYVSSDEMGDEAMKEQGGLDRAIKSGAIGEFIKSSAYGLIRDQYQKDEFVFDLAGGAFGSSKYSEASEKVRGIAKEKSVVIGLLPSEDVDESIKFLYEREKERTHFKEMDEKELLAKVDKNYRKFPILFMGFCDRVVYVKGKSAEDIAEEIRKGI